jgi:hypothetical protein
MKHHGLARRKLGEAFPVALLMLALCCLWPPAAVRAQTTVAITYFDEPLAAYGTWVEDPDYGRVWRPRGTGPEWGPYRYGRWVYTSEYGWVWVSEEPWGWVVYHYGHWVWSSRYGWVWVAGDAWGPAWVEWCYGDGYVGWAPMPPDPYWPGPYYYGSYECSSPAYYSRAVFVAEAHFMAPRVSAHAVAPSANAAIARGAVNVTSYGRVGGTIANRSIDVARLQARTGVTIKPLRVVQAKAPVPPVPGSANLRELRVYRPVIAAGRPLDLGAKPPPLKLDPDVPAGSGLSPPPFDTGSLPSPSLDRSAPGLSPPPLGGIGSGPSLGGGLLGGGRRLGR